MQATSEKSPLISVLIPAYNEELLIGKTLAAVHHSFEEVGWGAYEVIVCDNNSTDRTADRARKGGAKVVFESHNQISRARNCAAAAATGEWLIFVDADTSLNAPLLERTISTFQSGKVCGGGALIAFDRDNLGRAARIMAGGWNRLSALLHLAAGSYVFCFREAWADTGGFEEKVYAGEELFFSRKVRAWGRKRGLKFRVLADVPITTSARKLEWYSSWQLIRHMLSMAVPGAIRRQNSCGLWYTRPVGSEVEKG